MLMDVLHQCPQRMDPIKADIFVSTPGAYRTFLKYAYNAWIQFGLSPIRSTSDFARGLWRQNCFFLANKQSAKPIMKVLASAEEGPELHNVLARMLDLHETADDVEGLAWAAVALLHLQNATLVSGKPTHKSIFEIAKVDTNSMYMQCFKNMAIPCAQDMQRVHNAPLTECPCRLCGSRR